MASPVGHALAGWIGHHLAGDRRPWAQRWRHLMLCVAAANLADLDFIPGILIGVPDRFHHGAAHSIGAALLVGLLAWLWFRRGGRAGGRATLVFGLYLSHLFIDWAARDTRPPEGIPLLWPLSGTYFQSGIPLFLDIQRDYLPSWTMIRHNLLAVALEIAILLPPALALLLWRRKTTPP